MDDYKEKFEKLIRDIDIAIEGQKEGELKTVLQNIKERNTENEDEKTRKKILTIIENEATKISKLTGELPVWYNNAIEWLEKHCEQNPAQEWSDEDERLRKSCIAHIEDELERIRNDKYGHSEIISDLKESCRERINWLESLRSRNHWKPSDDQLIALQEAMNVVGLLTLTGGKLNCLYQEIKKL